MIKTRTREILNHEHENPITGEKMTTPVFAYGIEVDSSLNYSDAYQIAYELAKDMFTDDYQQYAEEQLEKALNAFLNL